jgi:hypothetical protein
MAIPLLPDSSLLWMAAPFQLNCSYFNCLPYNPFARIEYKRQCPTLPLLLHAYPLPRERVYLPRNGSTRYNMFSWLLDDTPFLRCLSLLDNWWVTNTVNEILKFMADVKVTVFWDAISCSLLERDQVSETHVTSMCRIEYVSSSTLKMEETGSFETLVTLFQITRHTSYKTIIFIVTL